MKEPLLLLLGQSKRDDRRPSGPEKVLDDDKEENAYFGGFTDAKEQTELVVLKGETLRVAEIELMFD